MGVFWLVVKFIGVGYLGYMVFKVFWSVYMGVWFKLVFLSGLKCGWVVIYIVGVVMLLLNLKFIVFYLILVFVFVLIEVIMVWSYVVMVVIMIVLVILAVAVYIIGVYKVCDWM